MFTPSCYYFTPYRLCFFPVDIQIKNFVQIDTFPISKTVYIDTKIQKRTLLFTAAIRLDILFLFHTQCVGERLFFCQIPCVFVYMRDCVSYCVCECVPMVISGGEVVEVGEWSSPSSMLGVSSVCTLLSPTPPHLTPVVL